MAVHSVKTPTSFRNLCWPHQHMLFAWCWQYLASPEKFRKAIS